jgi:hydroxypyruvate reductase 2
VDAAFLDAVPSLRFVFNTGAGMDHIDLGECARRGVDVANSGTVYSTDVADHAVGMLLDVLRRVSAAQRFLRRGLWPLQGDYHPLGTKVGGKRVGIIGLGNIGMLIAKRLQALGCVISYNSRKPKESVSYKYFASVHDLASESDVLVVACALSKETRHVVNRDVLDALGKDGVVINIGRGPIIDEAELVAALKEGRIAGAGLDVFEKEPKVPAELFSMDNVVLTPHVAVFTTESRSDLRDVAIGNLEAFFSGKPLLTPVVPR